MEGGNEGRREGRAGYAKDYLTSSNTPLSRSLVALGMRTWNSLVPSFPSFPPTSPA
jgi:hypothetical protein